ncbi:hypothetical protein TNIN_252041 [Trichonephila inaurata madagascariensis]|uniref:Uncharacterized protein n=1 Tax=Trichonephila inaurata madagascariensis TaxID=2747483 RepID=A0A8X7BUQ9_9ARAC|nr:hypothetical protein TNIN_252041 [Trichonephila inaurata madagascariensis]
MPPNTGLVRHHPCQQRPDFLMDLMFDCYQREKGRKREELVSPYRRRWLSSRGAQWALLEILAINLRLLTLTGSCLLTFWPRLLGREAKGVIVGAMPSIRPTTASHWPRGRREREKEGKKRGTSQKGKGGRNSFRVKRISSVEVLRRCILYQKNPQPEAVASIIQSVMPMHFDATKQRASLQETVKRR